MSQTLPNQRKGQNKGWANLRPAKKGEVRNPKGRPKGVVSIGQYYRNWLEADVNLKAVTRRLLKLKPDVILHYAYGKPVETNLNFNTTDAEAIADTLAGLWRKQDATTARASKKPL